jgi:hypothetical protein
MEKLANNISTTNLVSRGRRREEQSTHDPKFKDSNPDTADTQRNKQTQFNNSLTTRLACRGRTVV